MLDNIQAISTPTLHHLLMIQRKYGDAEGSETDGTTLGEVVGLMRARLDTGNELPFRCPKCKGKGDYTPDTDGIELPDTTPLGNVPITESSMLIEGEGPEYTPVRITCSICAGEGYTSTQVLATPQEVIYSNAI